MQFNRRKFLAGGAALFGAGVATRSRTARAFTGNPARNLILVVAGGGWDTTYVLDPKPGIGTVHVPPGEVKEIGGIPFWHHATRPNAAQFLEAYASQTCFVHGVGVQSIVHSDCSKRIMTGTSSETNPDLGAITAYEHGRDLAAPYLVLGQTSYAGPYASIAAKAGTANQLITLIDPAAGLTAPGMTLDETEEDLIRKHVLARAERERATRGRFGSNARKLADFADSFDRGDKLRAIGGSGDFDFTRDFSVQIDVAMQAFETGLAHVVQMQMGDWDSHDDNSRQMYLHEDLFAGLQRLMDELSTRPGKNSGNKMIDETVVAVISEMGRTPLLNETGGKDHWPVTSTILMGAGVAGGQAIGGTSKLLEGLPVDFETGAINETAGQNIQYSNLTAGILQLVGVDSTAYLPEEPLHAICS